jgi:hypothetical protein
VPRGILVNHLLLMLCFSQVGEVKEVRQREAALSAMQVVLLAALASAH